MSKSKQNLTVFNRIFNEIQIDIFASSYAVQVSYLNFAKRCLQLGVPS